MDRQLDSLTLLRRGCFCGHCPSPVILFVTIPAEMNTNKPCLKPPGRGYWPESQGRVSLGLKKRFLRLIFVRALWRDQGWWTGNKYPWFSTLVLLWRRHREESLNYVRSSEQCHGPLTSQVPGPIWGTIYCFLFVLQLSAPLTRLGRVLITHIKQL